MELGISWYVLLVANTLFDAALAGVMLFAPMRVPILRRFERVLDGRRLLVTGAVLVFVFVLRLHLLYLLGVRTFGLIHLIFLDLILVLPILCVNVLLAGRSRADGTAWLPVSPAVRITAWAVLALMPIGWYAHFVEPYWIKIEQHTIDIPSVRTNREPLRVGVLADLQFRHVDDYRMRAMERMMELEPDIILMPGDLYQGRQSGFKAELPAIREMLNKLHAPYGIYAVPGNIDEDMDMLREAYRDTPVRLLVNEIVRVQVREYGVTIGGTEVSGWYRGGAKIIRELQDASGHDDVRILLTHLPDTAFLLPADPRVDLVVCGHTHGGQVRVPLVGPPITFSLAPRKVCAGGFHYMHGVPIYVSRGVGWECGQAPRIRLNCRPEITLLTFKRQR